MQKGWLNLREQEWMWLLLLVISIISSWSLQQVLQVVSWHTLIFCQGSSNTAVRVCLWLCMKWRYPWLWLCVKCGLKQSTENRATVLSHYQYLFRWCCRLDMYILLVYHARYLTRDLFDELYVLSIKLLVSHDLQTQHAFISPRFSPVVHLPQKTSSIFCWMPSWN